MWWRWWYLWWWRWWWMHVEKCKTCCFTQKRNKFSMHNFTFIIFFILFTMIVIGFPWHQLRKLEPWKWLPQKSKSFLCYIGTSINIILNVEYKDVVCWAKFCTFLLYYFFVQKIFRLNNFTHSSSPWAFSTDFSLVYIIHC